MAAKLGKHEISILTADGNNFVIVANLKKGILIYGRL